MNEEGENLTPEYDPVQAERALEQIFSQRRVTYTAQVWEFDLDAGEEVERDISVEATLERLRYDQIALEKAAVSLTRLELYLTINLSAAEEIWNAIIEDILKRREACDQVAAQYLPDKVTLFPPLPPLVLPAVSDVADYEATHSADQTAAFERLRNSWFACPVDSPADVIKVENGSALVSLRGVPYSAGEIADFLTELAEAASGA